VFQSLKPTLKKLVKSYPQNKTQTEGLAISQVADSFPSKHEALISIPSTATTTKKQLCPTN
jgi:hypothetical protein